MIQLIDDPQEDLVAFRISGHVDKRDYNVMLPVLKERIKKHGKIRVYAELQDVEDYSVKALWEDVKFDVSHANDFTRAAIVGEQKWLEWGTIIAKPFTSAELKYFNFSDRDTAWAWINAK
jgi:hypothetical protein